jgi:mono/diheme cytochrome c family protein
LNAKSPLLRVLATGALLLCMGILVGCAQNLRIQPRIEPLDQSQFFKDGSSARDPIPGTVARGQLDADTQFYTGKANAAPAEQATTDATTTAPNNAGAANLAHEAIERVTGPDADTFPFPVTRATLDRGRQRYNIYCMPCHGLAGYGDGMVVQRGFSPPPSFHNDRLRQAPVGHFVDVITNGYGAMYSYAARVGPADRWAITAYIRALQLSQHASVADVPPDELQKLQGTGK